MKNKSRYLVIHKILKSRKKSWEVIATYWHTLITTNSQVSKFSLTTVINQMLTRMWSNQDSYSFLVEMQNYTVILEESLVISSKIKHTLNKWPSNSTPWHLLKGVEILSLYKNLHTDVCSSFIHNCQNLKATKISFSR